MNHRTTSCCSLTKAASLPFSVRYLRLPCRITTLRLKPAVAHAVEEQTQTALAQGECTQAAGTAEEAYYAATERLQTLLTDAELSNKDTVPMDFLDACSAEERLTLFTNLGTLGVLAAVVLCFVFGDYDPLGGMGLDSGTLHASLLGVGYAVPLLLCSLASRTQLKRSFPVLEEMHDTQQDYVKHLTAGMDLPQVMILLVFLVLPSMLLLLPASRAVLVWAGYFLQQALLQPWGSVLHAPQLHMGPLGQLLPPLLSSYLAGFCAASCFNVRPKQIQVVRDALRNADAYFRLTRAQQPSTAAVRRPAPPPNSAATPPTVFASSSLVEGLLGSDDEEDEEDEEETAGAGDVASSSGGQAAADAFRTVAMVWLISRRRVARLSYILTSLDVAYFAVVWQATGNLATPAAAAFLHAAAEVWLGEWSHRQGKVKVPVTSKGQQ